MHQMSSSDWEKRSWNQLQGVWGKRGEADDPSGHDSNINDDDDESVSQKKKEIPPKILLMPNESYCEKGI